MQRDDDQCPTPMEAAAARTRVDAHLSFARAFEKGLDKVLPMPLPDDYSPNAPHFAPLDSLPVYETPTGVRVGDKDLDMSLDEFKESVGKMTALDVKDLAGGATSMWAAQSELDPKAHAQKILETIDNLAKDIYERSSWLPVADTGALSKRLEKLVRKLRQWDKVKSKVKQLKRRSFWRHK